MQDFQSPGWESQGAALVVLKPKGGMPPVQGEGDTGERLDVTIGSDGRIESVSAPAGLVVEEHPALRG